MFDKNRACDSNSRKKDRYTKKELIDLSHEYRIVLPKDHMTVSEICDFYKTLDWKRLNRNKNLRKKRLEQRKKTTKKDMTQKEKRKEMSVIKSTLNERKKKKDELKSRLKNRKAEKLEKKDTKQTKKDVLKMASDCVKRSDKKIRDYQLNVVRFMQKNDRLLVYHKMGTGKTLTAVTTSQCYLDHNPDKKVIVITPASLTDNFKKAMMEYKYIKHADKYEFYSIQKATSLLKNKKLDCSNSMVILDEVHNYRSNIRFKKGKLKTGVNIFFGYQCFLKADKLLLLTGTPLYDRPENMNVYKVLLNYNENDLEENDTITDIIARYSSMDLNSLLCKVSFHDFEKNDSDFPERVNKTKFIKMKPEYERRYLRIIEEIFEEERELIHSIFQNVKETNLNQFQNLTRRATQNIDNNLELNNKLNKVISYIHKIKELNESLPNKDKWKVVIYSQFKKHGINLIRDMVDIPKAVISGDTKISDRQKIVNLYNQGKIQCLFITKAGGEGLDLKGTDAIILMEPTWNEQNNEQIIGRAIRYKSHEGRPDDRKKVSVIHLIHTTTKDRTEETKNIIERYLDQTFDEVPKMPFITESCDYMLSIFQKAKQKVLDYFDTELRNISIEKNKC
jgi:SNF2 family DNA or RNA helicase